MTSITSAGRPKLSVTDALQSSTPETTGENDNPHPSDVESDDDDEYEVSSEAIKQEVKGVQTKGTVIIESADLGIVNWPVMHQLQHGYFNERDVNEEEVAKLTEKVQAFDRRSEYPMCAAVNKAQLEELGIVPSTDPKTAPRLTPKQLQALIIVAIAGQHRQRSGQDVLSAAQKNLAASVKALHNLKLHSNDNTAAVKGKTMVATGVPDAEEGEGIIDPGHTSEEAASGTRTSDSQSLENGVEEDVLGVLDLEKLIEKQQKDVERLTYWPIRLVDKGQLPANSEDPAVLSALMSLSSNKAVQQNTGAPYEAWVLAQPILNTPQISMKTRVSLAAEEMSGVSVDLIKHGPMRRLIYTILEIPALRIQFNPADCKRIMTLPAGTLVIGILQALLNNLLKVFKPGDITKQILGILDHAYEETLQEQWCALSCDLETSDAAAPLSIYIENVKERLPADKSLTKERRQSMDAARTALQTVVKEGKVPLFSHRVMKDTIQHVPKVADAFSWAERYFSPDSPIWGSFTKAKKQNKRPDPAFAVIHELLYKDSEWLAERQNTDPIMPQLITLVFNCGREASNVITEHMKDKDPTKIEAVDSRVYTSFFQLLSKEAGDSRFASTTAADSDVQRPEKEVEDQLKGVPTVIAAISKAGAAKRLLNIIIKARNGDQRLRLASRLIYFIWTYSAENDTILGYTAVVKFARGLMGIGINRPNTPCLISEQIPLIDKEGLKDFRISSIDPDIWSGMEKLLKVNATSMSKILALLPQEKLDVPLALYKQLVATIRDIHKTAVQSRDEYVNEILPPNASEGVDYIQLKKIGGAASSTGSKSAKKNGEKNGEGSGATKSAKGKGKRADKALTTAVGGGAEGSSSKNNNSKKAQKKSGDKRKTDDVSDAEGRHDNEEGEPKKGRIAT